ncbi:hypothetical protein LTR15_004608 [Elasticomyces elasticus]|nr:hypothetical protein LTR15_004608 [Elasticomyces elasticus]
MAGGHTPGSSERCDECKQRRKKCDLQAPQCGRCRRGGRQCSGPKSKTLFVHRQTGSFPSTTQRQILIEAYRDRSADTATQVRLTPEQFYEATTQHIDGLRAILAGYEWHSSLTKDSVALSANQALLTTTYAALLSEFDPARTVGIFSADRVDTPSAMHYSNVAKVVRSLLPLIPLASPMLNRSIFSLLALYYGLLHGCPELAELARSSYTAVLGLYSRHLGTVMLKSEDEGSTSKADIFMYTSFALQAFEHVNEADVYGSGHLAHIDGALSFLQKLGPNAMRNSPSMRTAFSGFRGIVAFVSINRRQPSFLADFEWLQMPYMDSEKTTRDCLNDLGLEVPGHLAVVDQLLKSARSDQLPPKSVVDQCLKQLMDIASLRRRLENWYYALEVSTPGALFWCQTDPVIKSANCQDSECTPEYSNNFHQLAFSSGPIAGLLVQYWSFQLELLMAAIDLQEAVLRFDGQQAASSAVQQATAPGLRRDRTKANEVAQLILQGEPRVGSCLEGFLSLLPPLRSASRYFERRRAARSIEAGRAKNEREDVGHTRDTPSPKLELVQFKGLRGE